ncbi:hypothetical protein ZOSMA_2G01130 [Zostera marina]|uniref:Uncharacterized protein n=1 Tax=Zostera marina TaxID=29655 RepID=A0A0K9PD33_ZOSMR|nr:hypothetical protein ZOSMA_2G01130 [Zostera marina]
MATDDGEKKKRSRNPSSPRSTSRTRDGDGGKRKRRMDDEDDQRQDRKKHREKDAKRKHRSDDDKKKIKKKKKHGHRTSVPIEEQLSASDYFLKNNEFSAWLKEKKGIFFTDLSSVESRELFLDFIKVWNKGKLHPEYYSGITK